MTSPDILCCGEALIDMLPRKDASGIEGFVPHVGGAVFNTAIALGRLGAPVGLVSGVSRDLFGVRLEASLAASGVETGLLLRSDRPTTLAFVTLIDGQATYVFYDEGTAGRMLEPGDMPAVPDGVAAMFFGGISLVSEPCGAAYEALLHREASARLIMIDPNIRPALIRDEAAYRARIDRMIGASDVVKVSDDDLHWLMGEGSAENLGKALLDRGPRLVCVTRGGHGALGITARGVRQVEARRVSVADTVGAGDTFNAGILAGLRDAGALTKRALSDLPDAALDGALDLAARAAAVTVSRPGADPPRRDELL